MHPRTLLLCSSLVPLVLQAQSGTTEPVGIVTIQAPAHTDTALPISMTRPAVFDGTVGTLSGSVLSVADAPNWKTNQFTVQAHYVRFKTGKAAGRYYTVTASEGNRLTIDWNGEQSAASAGDEFLVIPFWTLATLLPPEQAGRSFIETRPRSLGTVVYARDANQSSAMPATFVFSGGAWRGFGQTDGPDLGATTFPPDATLMLRNGQVGTAVMAGGTVRTTPASVVINAQGGTARLDNEISLGVPASVSLAKSNLVGSGAFESSPSDDARRDELRVFNGSQRVATYYYSRGAWRKVGAAPEENFDQTRVFVEGTRVVLSKAGTGAKPKTVYWNQPRLVQD